MTTLGDAWGMEPEPPSGGMVSLDYARTKVREFQATLNALDQGREAALLALSSATLDDATYDYLGGWLDEFDAKRSTLKATAEALNMGANLVNGMGGRMPVLSIPGTLGLPFALPIAMIGALGAVAGLIIWGRDMLAGLNERLKLAQALAAQDSPEKAAALAQSVIASDQALKVASESGLAALAPALKWGAIAFAAFMLWRVIGKR